MRVKTHALRDLRLLRHRLMERLAEQVRRRRLRREIAMLCHSQTSIREKARCALLASPELSLDLMRQVAFRTRSRLAYETATLLYEMDDIQGLYALLSQYSDRYMAAYFGDRLLTALSRIGSERIRDVLRNCMQAFNQPILPREHWSPALSVYSLNALVALKADLPDDLWRRSLNAFVAGYEDLRVCRAVVPVWPAPLPLDDSHIGSTIVAVRRAAIDALLTLNPRNAFELLADSLQHEDVQVRLTAIYGLRRLRDQRSYLLLQPIAANRRDPLHRDARRAIEALGSSQPEALTLVRASGMSDANPAELVRPAIAGYERDPEQLLRPASSHYDSTDTACPDSVAVNASISPEHCYTKDEG